MPCPTCSHTMERVADYTFHCPRCGTLVGGCLEGEGNATVPQLVTRCREFGREMSADEDAMLMRRWEALGIEESISRPDQRAEGVSE